VVAINVQIAFGFNVQVNQSMACDLVEHVVKEANPGRQARMTAAVKIDLDVDARLSGIAGDLCRARGS
jgi:hypothetical protein